MSFVYIIQADNGAVEITLRELGVKVMERRRTTAGKRA